MILNDLFNYAKTTGQPAHLIAYGVGAGAGALLFGSHRIVGAALGAAAVLIGDYALTRSGAFSRGAAAGGTTDLPSSGDVGGALDPQSTAKVPQYPSTIVPPDDVTPGRYPYQSTTSPAALLSRLGGSTGAKPCCG